MTVHDRRILRTTATTCSFDWCYSLLCAVLNKNLRVAAEVGGRPRRVRRDERQEEGRAQRGLGVFEVVEVLAQVDLDPLKQNRRLRIPERADVEV